MILRFKIILLVLIVSLALFWALNALCFANIPPEDILAKETPTQQQDGLPESASDTLPVYILSSIEIEESTEGAMIRLTWEDHAFEDMALPQSLKFRSIEHYNTLRIFHEDFYTKYWDYLLVPEAECPSIRDSQFIQAWHEAPLFGSHSIAYDIVFPMPFAFSTTFREEDNQLLIYIEPLEASKPVYRVRTKSVEQAQIRALTTALSATVPEDFPFSGDMMKDENGYYTALAVFDVEKDAFDFVNNLHRAVESNPEGFEGFHQNDLFMVVKDEAKEDF